MTFWYIVIGTDLTFSNFFKLLFFTWDWSRPPMFSMFTWLMFIPFSHVSFFTRSHGQEKSLSYYDLFKTSKFYSTDAPSPSFSSTSSTTPPPLYSPSRSINDGPTWRRIPPGREVWSSGRSRLYLGGLSVVAHENNLSDICTNHNNIQSPEPGREWKIREVR